MVLNDQETSSYLDYRFHTLTRDSALYCTFIRCYWSFAMKMIYVIKRPIIAAEPILTFLIPIGF